MIVAHIMGIPIEESVLQLVPAGAATVTAVAIAARTTLGRLRHRRPGPGCFEGRQPAKACRSQLHSPQIKHDATTP